jgi:hypothetical protein
MGLARRIRQDQSRSNFMRWEDPIGLLAFPRPSREVREHSPPVLCVVHVLQDCLYW